MKEIQITPLSDNDRMAFEHCEERIQIAKESIETAARDSVAGREALEEVRDGRLYRENYPTFEDYCEKKWGFTKSWANKLIESVKVINQIENGNSVATGLRPVNIEQLKQSSVNSLVELGKSSKKNLSKVASKSLEISKGKPPTSKQVKIARAQVEHLVRPPRKEVPLVNFYVDPKPKTEPEAYDVEPEGARQVPDEEENLPFNWQWEAQKRVQKVYEVNKVKWNSPPPPAPSVIIEAILAELRKS